MWKSLKEKRPARTPLTCRRRRQRRVSFAICDQCLSTVCNYWQSCGRRVAVIRARRCRIAVLQRLTPESRNLVVVILRAARATTRRGGGHKYPSGTNRRTRIGAGALSVNRVKLPARLAADHAPRQTLRTTCSRTLPIKKYLSRRITRIKTH